MVDLWLSGLFRASNFGVPRDGGSYVCDPMGGLYDDCAEHTDPTMARDGRGQSRSDDRYFSDYAVQGI